MNKEELKENLSKTWYQSKTILFNSFVSIVAVLSDYIDLIKQNVDFKVFIAIVIFINLANGYLRLKTDKPIGKKDDISNTN